MVEQVSPYFFQQSIIVLTQLSWQANISSILFSETTGANEWCNYKNQGALRTEEKGTWCCTRDPYQWWHYLIRLLLPSNVRVLVLFHQNTSLYLDRQLLQSYCNVLKICWRLTVGAWIVMHSNTTVGSVILDNHFCTWQPISLCQDCSNLPRLPAIVISDIYFCASCTIPLCCNCSNPSSLLTVVISDIYFCASCTISLFCNCSNLSSLLTIVISDGDWYPDCDESMHKFMIQTI